MKFTILQSEFLPHLQAVSRSCGIRTQLPVLANILIQVSQNKLKLSATNLEIGVVDILNIDSSEDGEVTIPARTLLEIVSNLPGEKIEFESSAEHISVITPSFKSQINGISASEFPTIPLTGKNEIEINTDVILKAIPEVAFSAAVDDGRPILTGILTTIKNKKLELVATDGYRLAHKIVGIEEESEFNALVPKKTFEELLRLIAETKAERIKISLSEDGNQVIFSLGNSQISSRLIEGQFPNWEKIIPKQFKSRIVAAKSDLLKAVKLASVFARSDANVIRLQISNNKVAFISEAKELGSQQKELEAQIEGEDINIAFNSKFLQDVLNVISSSQVVWEFSGNLSAATIKPMGEEGLEYIVMPVNLS